MLEGQPRTGSHKADFTTIYDQPDPRGYFATLGPLDYQIPQRAMPVVDRVLELSARDGASRDVLDVCCSYGINAALMRYDVHLDDLVRHYAEATADPDEQIALDRAFFEARPRRPDLRVLGLDAAPNAIGYATRTGLLNDGWSENLESDDPGPDFAAGVRDVGLVLCTGGVGYVGAPTFDRIVSAVADPGRLWLLTFVLRVFPFDAIAGALEEHGLVTEQLPGVTFLQRRFADADEQRAAIADVEARGLDPAGKEADGWFHAECYLTRPAAETALEPVTEALAGLPF